MSKVTLLIADPSARVVERPGSTWILLGLTELVAHEVESASDVESAVVDACERVCDVTGIRVSHPDGRAVTIDVWKGITSTYEAFYSIRPGGEVVVSDHFRNMMSALPPEERTPSDESVVDHFLFRSVFGDESYAGRVQRAGHGEHLTIEVATGEIGVRVFVTMQDQSEPGRVDEYVDRVLSALGEVMDPLRAQGGVANQFSGGIDSTLMQTALGTDVPAVTMTNDTPEWQAETQYASDTAALLGMDIEWVSVREEDYGTALEEAILAMGMPPTHEAMPFAAAVYGGSAHDGFTVGQFAGSVFGKDGGHRSRMGWWARSGPARLALGIASSMVPHGSKLYRGFHGLAEIAEGMCETPGTLEGFAGRHLVYGDRGFLEDIFGADVVRRRLAERLRYTKRRVTLFGEPKPAFFRHVELDQWLEIFADPMLPERHLANAAGKTVYAPYAAGPMLRAARSVPLRERYIRGLQPKWLLKRALQRRLPAYPINQTKLHTALPFSRYYCEGPLAGFWDRYEVPSLFQGPYRDRLVQAADWTTWNAVTWAIWTEQMKDPSLSALPGSIRLNWPAQDERAISGVEEATVRT